MKIYEDYVELNQFTTPYDALWLMIIQISSVIVCYHSSKFACKVLMQLTGFAFPLNLTSPVLFLLMSIVSKNRQKDPCFMTSILSKEIFWQSEILSIDDELLTTEFWTNMQTLMWMSWWIAQFWITIHLWTPKHERLATSEK